MIRQNFAKLYLVSSFVIMGLLMFFPGANKFDMLQKLLFLCFFLSILTGMGVWQLYTGRGFRSSPRLGPLLLLFGFVAITGVSSFLSPHRMFAFGEFFVLMFLALFFLSHVGRLEHQHKTLAYGVFALLILNLLVGAIGFVSTDHLRFFGAFFDPDVASDAWPNAFAFFFLLAFPVSLHALFHHSWNRWNPLKWLLLGAIFGAFYLSFARAAMLAFAGQLALLVLIFLPQLKQFFSREKSSIFKGLALLVLGAVLFVSPLQFLKGHFYEKTNATERFTFQEAEGGNSFTERFEYYEGALELIEEKPVFGHGPSSFRWAYLPYQQGFLALADHPHNLLLKFASERGIPATIFFCFFVLFCLFSRFPFRGPESTLYKLAFVGLMTALAHSMIDHNLNFLSNAMLFWLYLALLCKAPIHRNRSLFATFAIIFAVFFVNTAWMFVDSAERRSLVKRHLDVSSVEIETYRAVFPRWAHHKIADSQEFHSEDLFVSALKTQIEVHPSDPRAYVRLGDFYFENEDFVQAVDYYRLATEVSPKNTFYPYAQLVLTYEELGRFKQIQNLIEDLEPLMEEYSRLYESNVHYTQSSPEMSYVRLIQAYL